MHGWEGIAQLEPVEIEFLAQVHLGRCELIIVVGYTCVGDESMQCS